MQTKSVADWIKEIRTEMMKDVSPTRASILLNRLSALLGNVITDQIDMEMIYNRKYEELVKKYEKVNEARARAKATEEYEQMLRAEGLVTLVEELIRSMKKTIEVKLFEAKETRYGV